MNITTRLSIIARHLLITVLTALPLTISAALHRAPFGLRVDFMRATDYYVRDGFPTRLSVATAESDTLRYRAAWVRTLHPSFAWVVQDDRPGCMQEAFRLIVADNAGDAAHCCGNVYDSGVVVSGVSTGYIPEALRLEPDKAYYWRVLVRTNKDRKGRWSKARLFRTYFTLDDNATSYEPLVRTRQRAATVMKYAGGRVVADFGRDAFAQPMLEVSAAEKGRISVVIGEKLTPEGYVDTKPGGTIRAARYELDVERGRHLYPIALRPDKRNTGPDAVLMPRSIGEVTPFRYCEVVDTAGRTTVRAFLRDMVSYQFDDEASRFSSSNDTLDAVFDLCKYSLRATSFPGLFVDGDRERIPYEADALISMLGTYDCFGEYCMARRTLRHLLSHPTWPTEWNLQTVSLALSDYYHTADTRLARRDLKLLEAHTLSALTTASSLISTRTGLQTPDFLRSINMKSPLKDITDWPDYGAGLNEPKGGERDGFVMADYNAVVNAWHYRALSDMAVLEGAAGMSDKAALYARRAAAFRDVYDSAFYDKALGRYVDAPLSDHSSAHANFYPLALGLCLPAHRAAVARYVLSRGMACSVFGAQFLLDALFLSGHAAEAIDMIKSSARRSWMNMMRTGATITMEDWDAQFKPNLDWNHAWATAPANLLMRRVLGITPTAPAFSAFAITPRLGALSHAGGWVTTMSGRISVSVSVSNRRVEADITVPANTKAVLNMDEVTKVLAGAVLKSATMDGKPVTLVTDAAGRRTFPCRSGRHTFVFTFR